MMIDVSQWDEKKKKYIYNNNDMVIVEFCPLSLYAFLPILYLE